MYLTDSADCMDSRRLVIPFEISSKNLTRILLLIVNMADEGHTSKLVCDLEISIW